MMPMKGANADVSIPTVFGGPFIPSHQHVALAMRYTWNLELS